MALLNNLAALYQKREKRFVLSGLYLRALRIKVNLLGEESEEIAFTLNNLAVFYRTVLRFGEAGSFYKRALQIFQNTMGASHPNVAEVLSNVAQLLSAEAQLLEESASRIERDREELTDEKELREVIIDPRRARFRLLIRPSKIHRFGLFTYEPIPAGSEIIE